MPIVRLSTPADRSRGVLSNMHPDIEGNVKLLADDLTEGKGSFGIVDALGNPLGFTLGQPPRIVARNLYMGTHPDKVTKQNTVPIPVHESSYLLGGPMVTGDEPPDPLLVGAVARPSAPTIQKLPATVIGYPASTPASPYWVTYSYNRNGKKSNLAPAVQVPSLAQGQFIKLILPDKIPVGATHIDVWLSQPGSSTTSTPGQMRYQKSFRFSSHGGHEVELTGPYVYSTERPTGTGLQAPSAPLASFVKERVACRMGIYHFRITAANELGESLPSGVAGPLTVVGDPYYSDDQGEPKAGYGRIVIRRPSLPSGASGYYVYAMLNGQWHRVFEPLTGLGLTKPFPSHRSEVITMGWSGSEEYAGNDKVLLSSQDLPDGDTSSVPDPDSPLEAPMVTGASRIAPGAYYARQTNVDENGEESDLSDAVRADIGQNDIPRVVFSNPLNRLPNATFVEKGSDGLPLGYTVVGPQGSVTLENGILTLDGSQDPEVHTDTVQVNPSVEWGVGAFLEALPPLSGAFSGSFEVVLREINASATQTDTVLETLSGVGESRYHELISPPGFTGLVFQEDTQLAQLVYRFSGANMRAKVSRQVLKDFAYTFRRREEVPGFPSNPNAAPETTANPSGSVAVESSPSPGTATETSTQSGPDRPTSEGVVIETQDFSGSVPWTQEVSGATVTTSGGKLICEKTAGGTGKAGITKNFAPEASLSERNDLGITLNGITIPTLPSASAISLAELRTPDGTRIGWVDYDNRKEEAKLIVDSKPLNSGDVTTTLDEGGTATQRTTPIVATRETVSLTINAAPSADGDVGVTLDGVTTDIPVVVGQTPQAEIVTVTITQGAAAKGICRINLGSPYPAHRNTSNTSLQATVKAGDSPETVARKLRAYAQNPMWQYDHWTISGTGATVVLTAKQSSPTYGGHAFQSGAVRSPRQGLGETHTAAIVQVTQEGREEEAADSPETVAQKIRETTFSDYETSGSGPTVEIEALTPGLKEDASYDPRDTGAGGSIVTTVQGAQDTEEEVAEKLVDTYSGNAHWTVSRTGELLTFSSVSTGAKIDATLSVGDTGLGARIQTTIQGSSDLVAYVKDRLGAIRQRRILPNVTDSSVSNIDLSVSGASTPPSGIGRGVVQVRASSGLGAQKTLRALFEDVDLKGLPTGRAALGVTADSSATWRVEIDEVKVTNRGETYYRYHDYLGELLNQVHGLFVPGQPVRDDLYLQGFKMAVLPDTEYTGSVFVRWGGFSEISPPKPFYLYCVTPWDEEKPVGDLIAGAVEVGDVSPIGRSGEWQEVQLTFTTPSDCHELRLASQRMGQGEIVCQEFCISKGAEAKRTPLYATNGAYFGTLDIGTPYPFANLRLGRSRKILDTDVEIPDGAAATVTYRAADTEDGPFGLPVSDPADLEEKNILGVDVSATGDGLVTPIIRSGFPTAEYVVLSGMKPIATFLKEDGTELDGGAIFQKLNRYAEPPEVVFQRLPGGRHQRTATYPPVGNQPAFELQVFTPEAKKFIEDRAGMVDFKIEAWEKILTVRLSGPVLFEPQIPDRKIGERWYGHWIGKLPEAQVVEVRDMP